MKKYKLLLYIPLILLGILMFVYAEIDDSPGGQLIGVIVTVVGVVGIINTIKKK